MALVLSDLLTLLGNNLQNHPKYTQALQIRALNKGQDELAKFARFNNDVWEQNTLQDGTGQYLMEYVLPDNIIDVHGVSFEGYPLEQMTLLEWQRTRGEKSSLLGDPDSYWVRNLQFLDIFPRPSRTGMLQVFIVAKPPDMSAATDAPTIPFYFIDSIISYATYFCLAQTPGEQERATFFWNLYLTQRGTDKAGLRMNSKFKVRRVRRQ